MAKLSQVGHLLDIPLEVEAVVEGRALRVSEVLELAVGSLVVSGRAAGENVDVMAGAPIWVPVNWRAPTDIVWFAW